MKLIPACLALLMASCAAAPPPAAAKDRSAISVEQARIGSATRGQFETWAVATIVNRGAADALVEVRTTAARSVVLRATNVLDAGASMRNVLQIPVPAHGTRVLATNDYYLAFIEAQRDFATGEQIVATLRFASGARIEVSFTVGEATDRRLNN